MVTQIVAQYPPHHVACAPAKFEVAMSNGLGDAFTIKCDLEIGIEVTLKKYCLRPFTSCDTVRTGLKSN